MILAPRTPGHVVVGSPLSPEHARCQKGLKLSFVHKEMIDVSDRQLTIARRGHLEAAIYVKSREGFRYSRLIPVLSIYGSLSIVVMPGRKIVDWLQGAGDAECTGSPHLGGNCPVLLATARFCKSELQSLAIARLQTTLACCISKQHNNLTSADVERMQ